MANKPDSLFLSAFRWFDTTVQALENGAGGNAVLAAAIDDFLRQRIGLRLDKTAASLTLDDFNANNPEAEALATAMLIVGESVSALTTLQSLLAQSDAAGLAELGKVINQIDRLLQPINKPPSAYSIAKLLFTISGDADQPASNPPAQKLVRLITGISNTNSSDFKTASNGLALIVMAIGTILDRSYSAPPASNALGWIQDALPAPPFSNLPHLELAVPNLPSQIKLAFETATPALLIDLNAGFNKSNQILEGANIDVELVASGHLQARLNFPPGSLPRPALQSPSISLGLRLKRSGNLVLGNAAQTHLSVGEISAGILLKNGAPNVEFGLANTQLVLKLDDPFLGTLLGNELRLDLNPGLVADAGGGLRLRDGTGLRTTIPIQKTPSGPFRISFLTLGVEPVDGSLNNIEIEISGSFSVDIGPFQGSVERLGVLVKLNDMLAGNPEVGLGPKWPTGAGLVIEAGPIKGGGFLSFDEPRGEYAGILDVKIGPVGVQAIGLLATKNPQGWSLLLVIAAQIPTIQLSWGFTLTGVGGLLGVQHVTNTDALAEGLANGSLDNFLFPQNPVGNAPAIIAGLRVVFPFKAGGFVLGPMLELGWSTPSLVTVRLGLLLEASQIVIVGQAIVQVPPLVSKDLAILRLQVDFLGYVQFDPLKIGFDGVLRDSRVAFIAITGQFAFRLITGDRPSFLISAGGFHPRFQDIPPGVPSPFQRVGACFDIGIVGVSLKGYFAVTSATIQAGAELRVWADVGVASFEGGFGFDAICYLVPRFYFDIGLYAYVDVDVFGVGLFSARLEGQFSGPGRWRVRGLAVVEIFLLPDIEVDVDEAWGSTPDTPRENLRLLDLLQTELMQIGNWSAQLPIGSEGFVTLSKVPSDEDTLLAHPNASLLFTQKRLPLAKTLDKVNSNGIEQGTPRSVNIEALEFGASTASISALQDFFSAAQFFDRNEEDKLSKPSFDKFEAGFQSGSSDYRFGAAVAEPFDYEEVNLSSPGAGSELAFFNLARDRLHLAAELGAAGRSKLRDPALLNPADAPKIKINPPPLAQADSLLGAAKLQRFDGQASASYWHAQDLKQPGMNVLEAFEFGL